MHLHRTLRVGLGTVVAASSLAALSLAVPFGTSTASAAAAKCSSANLPKSGKVDITFWEAMSADNETLIKDLINQFNASQSKVDVTDVNFSGGYTAEWDAYTQDLSSDPSALPNVGQFDQYITQGAVDSKSMIPVATCTASTKYSTSDFSKKTIAEETVGGKLEALPESVSAPILIYNAAQFAAAHITKPPTTVAQMAADAKKLKGVSYVYHYPKSTKTKTVTNTEGMTLKLDPWYLQIFQGTGDQYFVNNQNGRTARATAAAFDDTIGHDTFAQLQAIVKAGDATTNPSTGSISVAYANLFSIGYGYSGMTIDSSATLGTILQDLGLFPWVKLGVAEMPSIVSSAAGGVEPGGNALFLPSGPNASASKLAAAWEFIEYLDSPAVMAEWDAGIGKINAPVCKGAPASNCYVPGTGYVPITTAAAKESQIKSYWKIYPELKSAYNEIAKGAVNNATAGPLLGDYYTVYNDLANYETALLTTPFPSASSELSAASAQVTADIKAYNSSL